VPRFDLPQNTEMASTVSIAGSAYTYAYATLGELVAWIIGWDLVLAGRIELPPVLRATAVPLDVGMAAIRFSLGRPTTSKDVEDALNVPKLCIATSGATNPTIVDRHRDDRYDSAHTQRKEPHRAPLSRKLEHSADQISTLKELL
jgi:hypothetical protein